MSTNCVFPPELDDQQIMAYFDDPDAHQNTARHLDQCPHCREKAEALDRFQKRLKARLYRSICPSPEELGEYHLHMVSASERLAIAQHLRECPYCAQEVSELEEYLGDLSQPDILDQVKVYIAQLVNGSTSRQEASGFPQAQGLGGLRGAGDEPFIYQAGDVQLVIEVQEDIEQPSLKVLLGLATGLNSNEFTVEAYQEGKRIAGTSIDEIGNFTFTHLTPGLYDLFFHGPNTEIRIHELAV